MAAKADSALVLLVRDVLEPVDHLSILTLLDGDVGHSGGRAGAMPMFFTRSEPDYVTGVDFFEIATFALSQTELR